MKQSSTGLCWGQLVSHARFDPSWSSLGCKHPRSQGDQWVFCNLLGVSVAQQRAESWHPPRPILSSPVSLPSPTLAGHREYCSGSPCGLTLSRLTLPDSSLELLILFRKQFFVSCLSGFCSFTTDPERNTGAERGGWCRVQRGRLGTWLENREASDAIGCRDKDSSVLRGLWQARSGKRSLGSVQLSLGWVGGEHVGEPFFFFLN